MFVTHSSTAEARVAASDSSGIFDQLDSAFLIQTLLENPLLVVGVSIVLIYGIPRLVGLTFRYVVIPIFWIVAALLIVDNPEAAAGALKQALDFVLSHPYQTSIAILAVLAVFLSPYILTAGILAILLGGYQLLPSALQPFTFGPIALLEQQIESVQSSSRFRIDSAVRLWNQGLNQVSSKVDEVFRPIARVRNGVSSSISTARALADEKSQEVQTTVKGVISAAASVENVFEEGAHDVVILARDATKCTKLPSKHMRKACVKDVDMQRQSSQ